MRALRCSSKFQVASPAAKSDTKGVAPTQAVGGIWRLAGGVGVRLVAMLDRTGVHEETAGRDEHRVPPSLATLP